MSVAIEVPQLTEVNLHQILDIYKQQNHRIPLKIITTEYHKVVNIINLFHEIRGGGGGSQGIPTSV